MFKLRHNLIVQNHKLGFDPCAMACAPYILPFVQGLSETCSSNAMKPKREKGRPICGRCRTCNGGERWDVLLISPSLAGECAYTTCIPHAPLRSWIKAVSALSNSKQAFVAFK